MHMMRMPLTTGFTKKLMILSMTESSCSVISAGVSLTYDSASSRLLTTLSQKPFFAASSEVNVSTLPFSLTPGTTTSGSTIACAILGLRPLCSAVVRISERIYDWYLSGMISPLSLTTEAAPMEAPGIM